MANRYFFDKRDIKHFLIKYGIMLLISVPILIGINILFGYVFKYDNMVFLDNASTTRCLEESARIVYEASIKDFYNPSAKYKLALDMQNKLNECREVVKSTLGAINYNVVFTASATESNNMVLKTMISKNYTSLISIGEHSSIFETAKSLSMISAILKDSSALPQFFKTFLYEYQLFLGISFHSAPNKASLTVLFLLTKCICT